MEVLSYITILVTVCICAHIEHANRQFFIQCDKRIADQASRTLILIAQNAELLRRLEATKLPREE